MSRLLGPVYQAAYVVPDLEAAIREWVAVSGAGPFYVVPHFEMRDARLHGAPAPVDMSIALGFSGELCIELIEQHDRLPSVYRDVIDSGHYGFHHVARLATDLDAAIASFAQQGIPCAFRAGVLASSELAYLDARRSLHGFLELVSDDPDIRATLDVIGGAARNWDGSKPMRELG